MAVRTCPRCGETKKIAARGLCARCYTSVRRHGGDWPEAGGPTPARRPRCLEDHSWTVRAACLDYPHLPWTAQAGSADSAMRAICGACPVRAHCLAEALGDPAVRGMWAGTTTAERRRR